MITRVFIGPDGLRSGWRVLLFILTCIVCYFGVRSLAHYLPGMAAARQESKSGLISPGPAMLWELVQCLLILVITAVFVTAERRSWAEYGLRWRDMFGRWFRIGAMWGFVAMTCEILFTYVAHGFAFSGLAVSGADALRYGLEWALAFWFVAGFEEVLFRGYLLKTLARGIGFWPAAVILSLLFGAVHLQNIGEAWIGALQAGIAGFVFCFTIYRTGTLWFAIGFHTAWDWGQTFVYSVPDSGLLAKEHLLQTAVHGPWWITGGSVGPEGSLICTAVLLGLLAIAAWKLPPQAHRSTVWPTPYPQALDANELV